MWGVCNAQLWSGKRRTPPSLRRASTSLNTALQETDPAAAEAASTALIAAVGRKRAVEQLREAATRPRPDPHGAIYAAQMTRMLPELPPRFLEPVLGSLARYLARTGPPEDDAPPVAFNELDSTSSSEIADALRATPQVSLDGFSSRAIWEALARLAPETRMAKDSSVTTPGVHCTTLLDALWLLHDCAPSVERPQILQRAVRAVMALYRAPSQIPSQFESALAEAERDATKFLQNARVEVALKSTGEHDYKYFAAVEAVAPRLGPEARGRWLAALALAHPIGASDRWHRAEEVAHMQLDV
jgi:hypothetical protein